MMNIFLSKSSKSLVSKDLLLIFSIFSVFLLIYYGDSLSNGYSLDDEFIYTENPIATKGLSNISEIFAKPSFDYKNTSFGYRPITILSFAFENEFFGINPKVSHGINLLLYLMASFFFFKSLVRLFPDKPLYVPFFTALLFLVLPIHSEIANNVKCRDELLMLLFGVLAMYYWIRSNDKKYFLLISILLLSLSVLSKKSGFFFLGVLPLMTFFSSQGNWKKTFKLFALMLVPVILFRLTVKLFKESKGDRIYNFIENPLYDPTAIVNKWVVILESGWFYLKSLIFPTQFVCYYGYDTIPINGFHLTSVLAVVGIAVLGFLTLKGLMSQKASSFGALVLLGGLIPFLHIFQPMVGIIADRFATLPSLGYCILMVYGSLELLSYLGKEKWIKYLGLLFFIYTLGYLPMMKARNKEWNSNLSVLEADIKKEPRSALISGALANHYLLKASNAPTVKEKYALGKQGLAFCDQSLNVYSLEKVYEDKASIQFGIFKNYKGAEESLQKALELNPKSRDALNNIALMYKEIGEKGHSIQYFKKLIEEYPNELEAYSSLAQQLALTGNGDEAITFLKKGLSSNGNEYSLVLSMANVYFSMGDLQNALNWYTNAFEIKPNETVLKQRISYLQNQLKKAE